MKKTNLRSLHVTPLSLSYICRNQFQVRADKHSPRFDLLSSRRYRILFWYLFSVALQCLSIWQNTLIQTQQGGEGAILLYSTVKTPCVMVIRKKWKHLYATVTDRTSGFATDALIDGQNTRSELAKKTNPKQIPSTRNLTESTTRRGVRMRARTPSETHAPQMHPYMADVAERCQKLVPSLQYFTCVLYYTAVGTVRPRKWNLGQKYRFEAAGNEMVSTVNTLLAIDVTQDFNAISGFYQRTRNEIISKIVLSSMTG